jgi:hypothetical protein
MALEKTLLFNEALSITDFTKPAIRNTVSLMADYFELLQIALGERYIKTATLEYVRDNGGVAQGYWQEDNAATKSAKWENLAHTWKICIIANMLCMLEASREMMTGLKLVKPDFLEEGLRYSFRKGNYFAWFEDLVTQLQKGIAQAEPATKLRVQAILSPVIENIRYFYLKKKEKDVAFGEGEASKYQYSADVEKGPSGVHFVLDRLMRMAKVVGLDLTPKSGASTPAAGTPPKLAGTPSSRGMFAAEQGRDDGKTLNALFAPELK